MGIGIGIGVALLVAAAVIVWHWWRTRSPASTAAADPAGGESYYPSLGSFEMDGNGMLLKYPPGELSGENMPKELPADQAPVELAAASPEPHYYRR